MAQRLLMVAHGMTEGAGELVFGEPGDLLPGAVPALSGRIAAWASGPERPAWTLPAGSAAGPNRSRSCAAVTSSLDRQSTRRHRRRRPVRARRLAA